MGESKTWIDANGMHVNDESLLRKMEKVTASATLVEAYLNGCPAQFLFSSQLRKDVFPEGPDSPLKRGDAFHKVMELYYGIDEEKRGSGLNGRILNVCAKKVLSGLPDMFAKDHDFLMWLRNTMDDYIDMDEKYTNIHVAKYKEGHKYKPGLELEVSGYVGDASRRTYGKIDRLTDDGQGGVFIDDYKTGKKAKVYDPRDRFPQFDYVRDAAGGAGQGGEQRHAHQLRPSFVPDSEQGRHRGCCGQDDPQENRGRCEKSLGHAQRCQ